MTSYTV